MHWILQSKLQLQMDIPFPANLQMGILDQLTDFSFISSNLRQTQKLKIRSFCPFDIRSKINGH